MTVPGTHQGLVDANVAVVRAGVIQGRAEESQLVQALTMSGMSHRDWLLTMLEATHGEDALAQAQRSRAKGKTVRARIDHWRWIVDCPEGCNSGLAVDPEDLRGLCPVCDSGWFTVVFPDERAEIESILAERPYQRQRNWRHGETVASLRAERPPAIDLDLENQEDS
jgi:hypothetical protein